MMGSVVMTQALRNAGIAAAGHGFRSSFRAWARDDLLEKRRPVSRRGPTA